MKNIWKLLVILPVLLFLAACGGTNNNTTTTTVPAGTTAQTDPTVVEQFSELISNATEYSYIIVYDLHDGENSADDFSYTLGYAKKGTSQAMSMETTENEKTIFLQTATNSYIMYITDTEKTAYIYPNDDSTDDLLTPPDLGFLTDFDDSYDYVKKTENVMVSGQSTTCYEYKYMSYYTYKYYALSSGVIVKVEWTMGEATGSIEIKNFKTSNIDMTLLTVPTEAAGFVITDLTNLGE